MRTVASAGAEARSAAWPGRTNAASATKTSIALMSMAAGTLYNVARRRFVQLVLVAATPPAEALHDGSLLLGGEAPLFRGPARLRGLARPGPNGGQLNQGGEPCPGGFAVLRLRAVFPAVEDEHARGRHAAAGKSGQAGFDGEGKGRGADVEAQLDGGRDLVHVLSAGSGRPHEPLLDLALVRRECSVDRGHGSSAVTSRSNPGVPCGHRGSVVRECSGGNDVLGARTLRALADGERHGVALAHGVERLARARRLVEEILGAVGRGDEAEAFVRDALDCAGGGHCANPLDDSRASRQQGRSPVPQRELL